MNYPFLKDVLGLVEDFEKSGSSREPKGIEEFRQWIARSVGNLPEAEEPAWEGRETGRSPESVISTLIVHLGRYAKSYSKSILNSSDFATQEEFIYLINLRASGAMTKTELIKKNIQEKPAGIQIINRLIKQGWVVQKLSDTDRRSRVLDITSKGIEALDLQMEKIRKATRIVSADLTHGEKMELIRLLTKLEQFHKPIFLSSISPEKLLDTVSETYNI